jgi:hypothetical protein
MKQRLVSCLKSSRRNSCLRLWKKKSDGQRNAEKHANNNDVCAPYLYLQFLFT